MVVEVGDTFIEDPVPAAVPPHEPLYQCHVAPADNVPFTCNVVLAPTQIVDVPDIETGSVNAPPTVTFVVEQVEKHPPFSALTK